MKRIISYIKISLLSVFFIPTGCTQNTTGVHVANPDFDQQLSRMLRFDVPVISVDSFHSEKDNFFILDSRSPAEYEVSHIQDAHFLDYTNPDYNMLQNISHGTPIVVYCSVGYRSEKIGEQLQEMGYTQVFNLYGSIFEWANDGFPIVNSQGEPTDSLHTYNKKWSAFVYNPEIKKTW